MSRERSASPHLGCLEHVRLLRRTLLTGAATSVVLGGCAAPPTAQVTLGPGTHLTLNHLQGDDLKLVTEGEGEPARMLVTLTNLSTAPTEVTIHDSDDTASLTVSAGDTFSFTDNPTIFKTAEDHSGKRATMTFVVTADEEAVAVPVYQGPIGGYGDHFPHAPEN